MHFYTTEVHDKAEITSVSSEASGTAKENMLDGLLNTIYSPTVTSAMIITIDTHTTDNYVEAFGLWVANYGEDYTNCQIKLQYSTDNFSSDINDACSLTTFGTSDPLVIIDLSSAVEDKRYFRIYIPSNDPVFEHRSAL